MGSELYAFKTEPYAHQREALVHLRAWEAPEFAWLMDMGTGKSKVAADNVGILHHVGRLDGWLIVAPKTVCRNWSEREIPSHLPDRIARRMVEWRPGGGKAWQRQFDGLLDFAGLAILVMNVEALSTKAGCEAAAEFLGRRRALFLIDESTTIKNPRAKRTKAAFMLAQYAHFRRICTGQPITRDPLDVWAQFEFLRHGILGDSSFWSFRSRYAHVRERHVGGGRVVQEVVGFHDLEALSRAVAQCSYRVTKEECLDLPPKIYQIREVELTDEQRAAYSEMEEEYVATVEAGQCTAQIALTKLMRLQQIACGWMPLDDGTVVELPSNRVDALLEVADEAEGKVVIWCTYRMDVERARRALAGRFGPIAVATLTGETEQGDRQSAIDRFQDPADSLRFLIGTPKTGGVGITLTAAATVVYYSNGWDLEVREQSEARAHRIGQSRSVTYVDLVVRDSIDETVLEALMEKRMLASAVMAGTREVLLGMVGR